MADKTLAEMYLADRDGSAEEFLERLNSGQRYGQAFFNALSDSDQNRLVGTLYDPFYHETGLGVARVNRAIQWLLDTE